MKLVFSYVEKEGRWYPFIDVMVYGAKDSLRITALPDSGASFSVFRPEIADFLGIRIESGKQMYLEGVGGRILGYLHLLKVEVGTKRIFCKVVFSREYTVSLNLLGRDNFFEEFLITFDEQKKQVVLGG